MGEALDAAGGGVAETEGVAGVERVGEGVGVPVTDPEGEGAPEGGGEAPGVSVGVGDGVAPDPGIPGNWGASRPSGGRLPRPPPLKGALPGGLPTTTVLASGVDST